MKNITLVLTISIILMFCSPIISLLADEPQKDAWPLRPSEAFNVAIIGSYGEYRQGGVHHLAIDIASRDGEPVINNADGILLECMHINDKAGWRIVVGDINTLEGREFSHVIPERAIRDMKPGKNLLKRGMVIGRVCDFLNDGDEWNDHLHYAYVRLQESVNQDGYTRNVIEGTEHPLNRLEITPEIRKILLDAPPQLVEPIFFIPDQGLKGFFDNQPLFGKVDIVVHAFDRMGRRPSLGKFSPAPYEFEWKIIEPAGFENAGGQLLMDGRVPFVRGQFHSNYIENESWAGDFQLIITNKMDGNGFWFTDESKTKPGQQARQSDDALYPDGTYKIEVIIREHPVLGIPQRESRFYASVEIDNFRD